METPVETPVKGRRKTLYQEYDRVSIPEAVPELGVEKGNEGVVHGLAYDKETVHASVLVRYSTNQPRGWIRLQISPEKKVSSYAAVA